MGINRFIDAQNHYFENALAEIRQGKKTSHWIWYIFPQIHGLGQSKTSKYYEIQNINEAIEYINNNVLYNNLIKICEELLNKETTDIIKIMGNIDAIKLKSSMTLFDYILKIDIDVVSESTNYKNTEKIKDKRQTDIFSKILEKFYNREEDLKTIQIIENEFFICGLVQQHIDNMQVDERERAERLVLKYSEIAPIAIDGLGEFDGVNIDNSVKREQWYKSLTEKEFAVFCEFKELGVIDIAKEIRYN